MRRAARLAFACLAFQLCACEPLWSDWADRQDFPILHEDGAVAPAVSTPLRLRVMTWNVKFGGGRIDFWFDGWGDRTEMTVDEVEQNMAAIYALIDEVKPDVLMTNEIEVGSKRSAYYDMVRGILEHTDLAWAAFTPNWEARFVPSDGVGRVHMGNCIFSRFPLVTNERIAQVDRTDQDALTASFYLHRGIGRAELDAGGRRLALYTVHTEAYDEDGTNSRQQQQILELVRGEALPFVLAGDLNALPPTSVKYADFPDQSPTVAADFQQPPYRLTDLQPFFDEFLDAIGLARYGTTEPEQRRWYTHSVIGPDRIGRDGQPGFWNRRLDYLFVAAPDAWVAGSTDVLQQTGDSGIRSNPLVLSDHCPVVGTWEVRP